MYLSRLRSSSRRQSRGKFLSLFFFLSLLTSQTLKTLQDDDGRLQTISTPDDVK
jgi:hypothetical protein